MYLIDAPRIVKDTLRQSRLAAVNVSRDANITQVLNTLLRGGGSGVRRTTNGKRTHLPYH